MKYIMILLLQVLFCCGSFAQQKPKLYVFMPTNMRPNNMEEAITSICGQLQIQVFGKHRDLRDTIAAAPPDAILAPEIVSAHYTDFNPKYKGLRNNLSDEKYVLVSVDKKVDLTKIKDLAIGAVDLLGRREMMQFITERLGGVEPRKFEPVTKTEELLTILQFQDVDAIFVPEYLVDSFFKKRSEMQLATTELPGRVGLPVLSMKSSDVQMMKLIQQCLESMSTNINGKFGVDRWASP